MTNFSTRDVPWATVGTVIDKPVSAAEAMSIAGMNYDVLPEPCGYLTKDNTWKTIDDKRALVRQDTGECYEVASKDYVPVQFSEAFDFMDAVNPQYVAAGTLKSGRQGFLVAALPDKYSLHLDLRGNDDPHSLYVLLRTSHDRTLGLEINVMPLRHLCMNMLGLPGRVFRSKTKNRVVQRWNIRHTPNVWERMRQAQSVITATEHYAREFEEIARQLVSIDLTESASANVLTRALPDKPTRDAQVDDILCATELPTNAEFAGTGWGLVNATAEYFQYLRSAGDRRVTPESRFTTGIDGTASKMTADVMREVLVLA